MADFLEDDDPSDVADHRFGNQEWDKLEENFMNVSVLCIRKQAPNENRNAILLLCHCWTLRLDTEKG